MLFKKNKIAVAVYDLWFRPLSGYKSYGFRCFAHKQSTHATKWSYYSGKKRMMKEFIKHFQKYTVNEIF